MVTITGAGFTSATAVDFGKVAATSFVVNSNTQITATSPAEAVGKVNVTVVTAGGSSATSSADQFSYLAAPAVTGVNSKSGATTGGISVTITGSNLANATAVMFGTTPATIVSDSAGKIVATSPAGTGVVYVTVTAPVERRRRRRPTGTATWRR